MIRSITGERLTPKQLAQEIIMQQVAQSMYRLYEGIEGEGLTDRERVLVEAQIVKQKERIERLFGYEAGSWGFG